MTVSTVSIRFPSLICIVALVIVTLLIIITDNVSFSHIQINDFKVIELSRPLLRLELTENKTNTVTDRHISKCACAKSEEVSARIEENRTTDTSSAAISFAEGNDIDLNISEVLSKQVNLPSKRQHFLFSIRTSKSTIDFHSSIPKLTLDDKTNSRGNPLHTRGIIQRTSLTTNAGKPTSEVIQTIHGSNIPINSSKERKCKDCAERTCFQNLPACIIIGIQKCGTKALAEFLSIHPNISVDSRQTYFFSQYYHRRLEWYQKQMPCSSKYKLTLERTPQYFYFKDVPKRIYDMNKFVKLILIVRDPVTRAVSNFAMAKDRNRAEDTETFKDCVLMNNGSRGQVNSSCKYIKKSNYQRFMKHWLEIFPINQIHVTNGDQLITDPVTEIVKIEKFLGIPHFIHSDSFVLNKETGFKCLRKGESDTDMNCLSRKKGRKHPVVKDRVISKLKQYFKPLNQMFFEMVGQRFDW